MKMSTNKEQSKEDLAMNKPPIVSQQEWEAARQQLLVNEKALTRSRDALAAERRRMPWMAVEKNYEFDGPNGCSAHTSSTTAATRRWGPRGATSTLRRSAVRRLGRIRQRVTPRRRRTSGGTGTTTTTPRPRRTRSGSRCPTLEKPPSESATQRRKRAKGLLLKWKVFQ